MKTRYEAILFDFDGTLVDTASDIAHYANIVLERNGFRARTLEEVKRAVGRGVHELLQTLAPDFNPTSLEKAVEEFKTMYREDPASRSKPFEGVEELLGGPLKNLRKAICTNKPQDITEQILKALKIDSHFDLCVGLFSGFPAKPDPASANHILETLGLNHQTTLFIGDSYIDGFTAANCKLDFGYCTYGYDSAEESSPMWIFNKPADWMIAIDSMHGKA